MEAEDTGCRIISLGEQDVGLSLGQVEFECIPKAPESKALEFRESHKSQRKIL